MSNYCNSDYCRPTLPFKKWGTYLVRVVVLLIIAAAAFEQFIQ